MPVRPSPMFWIWCFPERHSRKGRCSKRRNGPASFCSPWPVPASACGPCPAPAGVQKLPSEDRCPFGLLLKPSCPASDLVNAAKLLAALVGQRRIRKEAVPGGLRSSAKGTDVFRRELLYARRSRAGAAGGRGNRPGAAEGRRILLCAPRLLCACGGG